MKTCLPLAIALLLAELAYAEPFPNGNVETGKKMVAEHHCDSCHQSNVGGDGTRIYTRPERKITSAKKLSAQVAFCNAQLNAGLFPEDEEHISAFLNTTYYKFKQP
jgi:cytochrome c2